MATLQDRSFVLCDVNSPGFPIRRASAGFEELFGFSSSECIGKKCGAVVGCEGVLDTALDDVADACEISADEASRALLTLSTRAGAEMQTMLASPARSACFAMVLNRKKSGELVVCELDMQMLRHPTLGWSYCVGMHSDVSRSMSPAELLQAALQGPEALRDVGQRRREDAASRATRDLLSSEASLEYLHGVAAKMWQEMCVSQLLPGGPTKKQTTATPSMASRSTTASGLSALSGRSGASDASAAGGAGNMSALMAHFVANKEGKAVQGGVAVLCEAKPASASSASERFFDILEDADEARSDDIHTPESVEVAEASTPIRCKELCELDFPLLLADPSLPGCQVVASSAGHADLTEYSESEVLGAGLGDLLQLASNVPSVLFQEFQRLQEDAEAGCFYGENQDGGLVFLGLGPGVQVERLAAGELCFVHAMRSRSKRLLQCMLHLKAVQLDGKMFIMCSQEKLPDPDVNSEEHKLQSEGMGPDPEQRWQLAYDQLDKHMDASIMVLAAQFWYSAPMRRQTPCLAGRD